MTYILPHWGFFHGEKTELNIHKHIFRINARQQATATRWSGPIHHLSREFHHTIPVWSRVTVPIVRMESTETRMYEPQPRRTSPRILANPTSHNKHDKHTCRPIDNVDDEYRPYPLITPIDTKHNIVIPCLYHDGDTMKYIPITQEYDGFND